MDIRNNIELVENLKQQVTGHCMCLDFIEDKFSYKVIFPQGYHIDGVNCDKNVGKQKALKKILDFMENVWMHDLNIIWEK